MNRYRWIILTLGIVVLGAGTAQAQANLPNSQLAEQWVRCLQGRPSTAGDCSVVQSEFNRRANEVRQRDLRVQRGETIPEPSTATPAARPPAASPPTPAAPPPPPPAPPRHPPNQVASEDDPSCAGREVILIPGGYLCR